MFWGNLPHADGFDYYRVLREVADRAAGAISSVYDDLQRRKDALIAIPESDRKKLANQVKVFYAVSSMGGGFAGSYLGSALGKWVVDITYAGD